jgi:Ca2+-binding EF-hand superfamily protein
MRMFLIAATWSVALGLSAAPARAQQTERKQVDIPGPIDSLSDLRDTGRMIFKLADANDDNQISQKEAIDAANLLVGGFFFRADQNGDGVVSQEEVKQAREAFLSTRPWLRYVIETARTTPRESGQPGQPAATQNPMAVLGTMLDTNNDKQLQASEVRQAVQTAVQGLFATADTNRDGQLSESEVSAGLAGMARTAAQTAFQQADTDHNGQISQAEFEKAIVEPARVAFRILDLNHDGQISEQEAQTARQVITSKLRALRLTEPSSSPRTSAFGSATQPAPATTPPSQPR